MVIYVAVLSVIVIVAEGGRQDKESAQKQEMRKHEKVTKKNT